MKFALRIDLWAAFAVLFVAWMYLCATPERVKAATMLSRADIVALTNVDRTTNGRAAVAEDALLDKAAQLKAADMVARDYFSHISPTGITPWYWMTISRYYYLDAGENLAQGFSDAASLNSAWMDSASHRENILDPLYTKIGIGIAQGTYQGRPATFVVQFFAKPAQLTAAQRSAIAKGRLALK